MRKSRIRVIALGVIWRRSGAADHSEDELLVFEGHDRVTGETFYRPLGGGVEFGETGAEAVARELREEIGAVVTGLRYLGTLENIFMHEGAPGHELIRLYEGEFADRSLYAVEEFVVDEGEETLPGLWLPVAAARAGRCALYPDGLIELLDGRVAP